MKTDNTDGTAAKRALIARIDVATALRECSRELFPQVLNCGKKLLGDVQPDWMDRGSALQIVKPLGHSFRSRYGFSLFLGDKDSWNSRFRVNAREKFRRLEKMHASERHLTSFESRDVKLHHWQGAIIIEIDGVTWNCSMSGLPEQGDEAHQLLMACKHAPDDPRIKEQVTRIIKITGNEVFMPLHQAILDDF